MEVIVDVFQQLLGAIGSFFAWIFGFLALIINTLTMYIPRQFLLGGLVIIIMIAILLRVGLKPK